VKIRGTASHVAEKYMSLARDALASGDMIAAESYLQHAEHYNRIVMAAQTQLSPPGGAQPAESPNGGGGQQPQSRWHSDSDEEGSDEAASAASGQTGGGQGGGGGGQDRERHTCDREHHGGGRDRGRRPQQGGNGSGQGVHDANGAEPADAQAADEGENAPDVVS
jgi:hypothetical protein